ncbi:MAG: yycG 6 [Mucilaginibacter sp.]|nr:yycG 6 [Mucilaginibacter sp.]
MEPNFPISSIEERYKIIADIAPVQIWIANIHKLRYFFNARWLHFTGRTLEQEYGNGWTEGVHPDDLQRCLEIYTNSFQAGKEFKIEYRLRRHDGKYLWLLDHGVPRYLADGSFGGYVGSAMIIDDLMESEQIKKEFISAKALETQQALNEELAASNEELASINKELLQTQDSLADLNNNLVEKVASRTKALAESEAASQALNKKLTTTVEELSISKADLINKNNDLSASEHNTRNIVTNAPFPIGIYIGKEMRITIANQAIIDVWGKGNEVIGKLYSEVLPELENQEIFAQLDQVFTTGIPFHARNQRLELIVDGEVKTSYFNYSFTALHDQAGEIYGVMNTAAEVTDIVLAKLEVEQSEKNLYNMVRQAPVGMCILKGQPLFVEEVNNVFLEIIGKERHQFKDTPYWVVNAEAAPYYEPITDNVMATGETYRASEHEIMLIRNGREEIVHVDFVYEPIKDINRNVDAIMIVAIEVTDKVAARKVIEKASIELANLNEELAAANEEMAATNEEMAAVNEELAATNEELTETQANLQSINNELAESEYRLSMAIESTHLGTWDYNPVSGQLYWSEEAKNIFGFPVKRSITIEAFANHIHQDDLDRIKLEIQKSLVTNNTRYDVSCRILRFDNDTIRWVRIQGTVNLNAEGRPVRYLGTILDITENKLAQEALARSEKLFKSIALNIPKSLVIVIDKEHRYVTIEGDIMAKMGYDSKDYAGKHPTEVAPPERYEASRHLYERVMAGEKFSVERKSATDEYYMVHFVPLKNEHDEVYAGLIIALDITDIKEAEEKSAKLAAIIESSDDAIISKTLGSVITSWNDSAERIFGYAADEIIGETIYKLIPEDRQEEEPNILSRLKTGERVEHFETKRITKYGQLIDVSITVSPVKDKQGNIIGLSKIARDITERKKDDIRKNDFIGMVSHELKTPLTSLNAIIQVANAKLKNSEDAFLSGAMNKANIQVKRMSGMINGFLNISRLESGKILIEKSRFDMEKMILEVIDEVKLTVSTHTINFTPGNLIEVYADPDKIGSVISNLISNAIKYSPRGKSVEIKCELANGRVIVSVRDEGIGIKPQDAEKIFDRYYRVESNHTQHISGFGIGLYLSAEIIKRHDGEIWVESEDGIGSTFYFSLPI